VIPSSSAIEEHIIGTVMRLVRLVRAAQYLGEFEGHPRLIVDARGVYLEPVPT
jgi:hypothetical protein